MERRKHFGKFGLHKHSPAKEIIAVIGREVWRDYYSWCTVRNPFSRTASLYNYVVALVETYADAAGFPIESDGPTQSAWAEREDYPNSEPWSYAAVKAYLASRGAAAPFSAFLRDPFLGEDSAFQPQWWSVQDESGEAPAVNDIVKLEELETAWPRICERIGVPGTPLTTTNVSMPKVRKSARELFGEPDDIQFIRDRFHEDFGRFGYDPAVIP